MKRSGWKLIVRIDGKGFESLCINRDSALTMLQAHLELAQASTKTWKSFSFSIKRISNKGDKS